MIEMTREEALKIVRENYPHFGTTEPWLDLEKALATLIPELRERESEDERIRKRLITLIRVLDSLFFTGNNPSKEQCLAYLEKQKDASKAIEAVDRIDKYIDEHLANAHDMKDSNPDKKYYRGWDDALGKMAGILQDVYSDEKQKEQKPADRFEEAREKYQVEWSEEDEKIRKELIGMVKFHCADEHLGRYLNWLENRVKFLRPQPKQEWSGRDEEILEFVLGLLDNLVWRKDWEISQAECLEWLVKSLNPTKQEWNEEDERIRKAILGFLNPDKGGTKYSSYAELVKWSDWLKSLRPSWKPSEEQMDSLRDTIVQTKGYSYSMYLPELYEQLKKLM